MNFEGGKFEGDPIGAFQILLYFAFILTYLENFICLARAVKILKGPFEGDPHCATPDFCIFDTYSF